MVSSKVLSVSATVLMGPAFLGSGSPGASAGSPGSFPARGRRRPGSRRAARGGRLGTMRTDDPVGHGASERGHEVADAMAQEPAAGPRGGRSACRRGAVAADLAAVSRRARWAGAVFAVLAVLMVPWTVYLAVSLPSEQRAAHYDLAWAGFDVGLFAVLLWAAWSAATRSRWLAGRRLPERGVPRRRRVVRRRDGPGPPRAGDGPGLRAAHRAAARRRVGLAGGQRPAHLRAANHACTCCVVGTAPSRVGGDSGPIDGAVSICFAG